MARVKGNGRWKMKVHNTTDWSTFDLRVIFRRLLEERGWDPEREINITVKNRKVYPNWERNPFSGSHAWLNSGSLTMALPPDVDERLERMAQVFCHEVDHCLGLRHRDMMHSWNIDVSCIDGIELGKQKDKTKTGPKPEKKSVQVKRAEHARLMLKKHTADLKRKLTLVRKWKKKVEYYDRALARKARAAHQEDLGNPTHGEGDT